MFGRYLSTLRLYLHWIIAYKMVISSDVDLQGYDLNNLGYKIYDAKGSVIPGGQATWSDSGMEVRMQDAVPGQYVMPVTVEGRKMTGRFTVSGR